MKHILTLFLISFSFISFSQTTLPGGNMSGVITLSGSPYTVTSDVFVQADSLLTIEPGVVLDFADTVKLIVRGNISAQGTAASPITFTCSDSLKGWGGIMILNDAAMDTNYFKHCLIEYTGTINRQYKWIDVEEGESYTMRAGGLQSLWSSPLKVEYCDFRRHNLGIRCLYGDIIMHHTDFYSIDLFGEYVLNETTV